MRALISFKMLNETRTFYDENIVGGGGEDGIYAY